MSSSLVIMTNWILNENKTFTFYEQKKNPLFATGLTKDFKYENSDKVYKMYEHRVSLCPTLIESQGFHGY
jgi:vancomycin permeability regulator SanA